MKGKVSGSCPFCDEHSIDDSFDDAQELQEIMAEWEGHLLMEHCSDMVEYLLGKTHWSGNHDYDKRRIVKGWGGGLIASASQDVECPFCDYTPPEEYESSDESPFDPPMPDPWYDTKLHIADEHWDEFLEWIDTQFLAIHENAMEKIEEEYVEYDLEDDFYE